MSSSRVRITAIILASIIGLLITSLAVGVLGAPRGSSALKTQNIDVYLDPSCISKCVSIDWGKISPGSTVTKTVYIKYTGDTAVTLSIMASNWNPRGASSMITLSWNCNNYQLSAGKTVPAILTLNAASNLGSLTKFVFIITVTGTRL
jgi:hypothetical protein